MNIERLASILRQAAKDEIMPRFRRLDEGMIQTKTGAFDLVTEADTNAERVITAAILDHSPKTLVIGEEAVAANPALLSSSLEDRNTVYVDPVDGTANFAGGLPLFAVMAAVVQNGEPVAGIIYDPMGDDFLMAEKGCGTWQVFPDGRRHRLRYADPVPLSEMGGLASTAFFPFEQRRTILGNLAKVKMIAGYRCAGHEYRFAAGGNVHFLAYGKLMPWDHVAGALMMQECGAHVAKFDGSAYRPGDVDGGLLVAPDKASWDELKREVFAV
ncbi:inositol monophosphatase family protein [Devosia faecipullorum]|uniref:inositol monophosphatase family protein n=1 Tax=Devosia faecipullorum TaxID=2755039 RepID=UPI00187B1C41|nr:inositol monophosphatase [Devosia faecipullorum]MBE7732070.1 inositol monophosphatase [Devosia faecipullorum]